MSALLDTPAWRALIARCDHPAALAYPEVIVATRNGGGADVLSGAAAQRAGAARAAELFSRCAMLLVVPPSTS